MGAVRTVTAHRGGGRLFEERRSAAVYRHPGDLVRVGLGIAVLGLAFLVARRGELSVFEVDVFRLFNDLPALIYVPVWLVMQLGNGIAIGILAGAAAVARRFRMARDLVIAAGRPASRRPCSRCGSAGNGPVGYRSARSCTRESWA